MGLYDTYGDEQLKVGDVCCRHFAIGDKVDLEDGIYVGYHNAIVILHKVFIAEVPLSMVYDKWGGSLQYKIEESIIDSNPIKLYLDREKANPDLIEADEADPYDGG